MELKICKLLLLVALVTLPAGCASHDSADDTTPAPALETAPNPMPDHDDSHGWGTSVQNVGGAQGGGQH